MKNVMNNSKKVLVMVALLTTIIGYANENSFFNKKDDNNKIVLTFKHVKAGNLFTIKDENGNVLYKEKIQEAGNYKKGFDVSNFSDGNYFYELDKDVEITVVPFTIRGKEVQYFREKTKTIFKPVTVLKGDMVFVTKLALQNEALDIKVYSDGNSFNGYDLIHSESIDGTKNIERIFKIENFEKGSYKIVYKTQGRLFVEYM